jgi:hypothetical protein
MSVRIVAGSPASPELFPFSFCESKPLSAAGTINRIQADICQQIYNKCFSRLGLKNGNDAKNTAAVIPCFYHFSYLHRNRYIY